MGIRWYSDNYQPGCPIHVMEVKSELPQGHERLRPGLVLTGISGQPTDALKHGFNRAMDALRATSRPVTLSFRAPQAPVQQASPSQQPASAADMGAAAAQPAPVVQNGPVAEPAPPAEP